MEPHANAETWRPDLNDRAASRHAEPTYQCGELGQTICSVQVANATVIVGPQPHAVTRSLSRWVRPLGQVRVPGVLQQRATAGGEWQMRWGMSHVTYWTERRWVEGRGSRVPGWAGWDAEKTLRWTLSGRLAYAPLITSESKLVHFPMSEPPEMGHFGTREDAILLMPFRQSVMPATTCKRPESPVCIDVPPAGAIHALRTHDMHSSCLAACAFFALVASQHIKDYQNVFRYCGRSSPHGNDCGCASAPCRSLANVSATNSSFGEAASPKSGKLVVNPPDWRRPSPSALDEAAVVDRRGAHLPPRRCRARWICSKTSCLLSMHK